MAINDALHIIDAGSRSRTSSLEIHRSINSSFRSSLTSKSFTSIVTTELKNLNKGMKSLEQATKLVIITGHSQMKVRIFSLVSMI